MSDDLIKMHLEDYAKLCQLRYDVSIKSIQVYFSSYRDTKVDDVFAIEPIGIMIVDDNGFVTIHNFDDYPIDELYVTIPDFDDYGDYLYLYINNLDKKSATLKTFRDMKGIIEYMKECWKSDSKTALEK